jgi:hypothetical protein
MAWDCYRCKDELSIGKIECLCTDDCRLYCLGWIECHICLGEGFAIPIIGRE